MRKKEQLIMMKQINLESLDQAIESFNSWGKAALIYYNRKEDYFETEVYHNDVQMAQTVLSNDCVGVASKKETENLRIGENRRQYIIDYVELINDGWDAAQATYQMVVKYGYEL